jgi:hypothetical protein
MADREIGYIELTATTRITFAVGSWKGQARGTIRKFVSTEKYSGPTKSGMSLDGATLAQLLTAVRTLQATVPTKNQSQHLSVGKTRDWEIRVTIIAPDEESALPAVDIREYVENPPPRYSGPTKSGVRFSWNKLKQFIQLTETLVQHLGATASSETSLFPDLQPTWISEAKQTLTPQKPSTSTLDPSTLKQFPDAFLAEASLDVECITLPPERLKIVQDRSGLYFVTDHAEFRRQVRNEVEGKFFLYAQQRGILDLRLPKEMFKVFSAVAGYEKYCRELRQKLLRELEARSGNRTLADHVTRETFETHGLPVC